MPKTRTFFMFVGDQCGKAEEAVRFYTSLFPDSAIVGIERWREGEPGGVAGQVKTARFTLAGQEYMASENAADHPFTFTPAISIFVDCADEEEINRLHGALAEGGRELMPLGDYGFSTRFGWVEDRYGVSWQLNLAG